MSTTGIGLVLTVKENDLKVTTPISYLISILKIIISLLNLIF